MQRLLIIGLAAALTAGPTLTAEKKVDPPKVVKFADLIGAIKEYKGKVVVVDFWADT